MLIFYGLCLKSYPASKIGAMSNKNENIQDNIHSLDQGCHLTV